MNSYCCHIIGEFIDGWAEEESGGDGGGGSRRKIDHEGTGRGKSVNIACR